MKRISTCLIFALLLTSCGPRESTMSAYRAAEGGVNYGGVFRLNEVRDFRSLFPLNLTEVTAHRITNQIYEGLVKFDQTDLTTIPALAERWEINEDATEFTFHLRKGVRFHDDACFAEGKGREVNAHDFQYVFQRLCTAFPENQMFWVFKDRVEGANEYYQSTREGNPLPEGVSGIKVIDDYTLSISLQYPFAGFLNILALPGCWVYPKEAYETYGISLRAHCVGTGPFHLKTIRENDAVVLERNPNYWKKDGHGNTLPYLDAIKFSFLKEKKTELLKFRNQDLDMIFTLPIEMIGEVMSDFDEAKSGGNFPFEVQLMPAMGTQYYAFQHQSKEFSDRRVRQAFNYAIDRKSLLTYALQGDGVEGAYGIVPPAFSKYNHDSLVGYTYDPDKARKLLKEAGYADGKGFPKLTLELNSGGSNNELIAQVIQKMLEETLNIDIELSVLPAAQHLDNAETGKSLFWRDAWLADYPDPENFLNLLYGKNIPENKNDKSYINSIRYHNPQFDSIFELAIREVDMKKRYRLYRMADQIALDDAAIIPIYYEEFTRLLHPRVQNFPQNGMEYRDFSEVYFKELEDDSLQLAAE